MIEIKSLKEAEDFQKKGNKLVEVRGLGENRVYVFEDQPKKKEVKNEK